MTGTCTPLDTHASVAHGRSASQSCDAPHSGTVSAESAYFMSTCAAIEWDGLLLQHQETKHPALSRTPG